MDRADQGKIYKNKEPNNLLQSALLFLLNVTEIHDVLCSDAQLKVAKIAIWTKVLGHLHITPTVPCYNNTYREKPNNHMTDSLLIVTSSFKGPKTGVLN